MSVTPHPAPGEAEGDSPAATVGRGYRSVAGLVTVRHGPRAHGPRHDRTRQKPPQYPPRPPRSPIWSHPSPRAATCRHGEAACGRSGRSSLSLGGVSLSLMALRGCVPVAGIAIPLAEPDLLSHPKLHAVCGRTPWSEATPASLTRAFPFCRQVRARLPPASRGRPGRRAAATPRARRTHRKRCHRRPRCT